MDKRFLSIIAAIILLFVGIAFFNSRSSDDNQSNSNVTSSNHVKGGENAKVSIVEFGDFQCPSCYQYYPIVSEVIEEYGDQISFQFRHLPLTNIHPNAYAAARAAEAAGKQGKFWEMYDELFNGSNWSTWTNSNSPQSIFDGYAKKIGLNEEQYKKDFASDAVNQIVRADMKEAEKQKFTSTPSFMINGEKVNSIPMSLEGFKAVIDPLLAEGNQE